MVGRRAAYSEVARICSCYKNEGVLYALVDRKHQLSQAKGGYINFVTKKTSFIFVTPAILLSTTYFLQLPAQLTELSNS